MCLIAFAYRIHPRYKFILVANRDEFWDRPTKNAHWWDDDPHILAGKDMKAHGTWLGVSRTGQFTAVTNYREVPLPPSGTTSRGHLTRNFLKDDISPQSYVIQLAKKSEHYSGFNLIVGNLEELYYCSNRTSPHLPFYIPLPPGVYGLSNRLLDTPWPKVLNAKSRILRVLSHMQLSSMQLLDLLSDHSLAKDSALPNTGVDKWLESKLSAMCIDIPESRYGTRITSALLIDYNHNIHFHEKSLENGNILNFHFQVDTNKMKVQDLINY